ncbi:MAG TPA: SRPBCC family protein [Pirellulales bacterium]
MLHAALLEPGHQPPLSALCRERKAAAAAKQDSSALFSMAVGGALLAVSVRRRSLAGAALALAGAGVLYNAARKKFTHHKEEDRAGVRAQHGVKFKTSQIINRSRQDLFDFWSNLDNLPRVMSHLLSVKDLGDGRSRWVAQGPLAYSVEWEAETIVERAPEVISWQSLPGSEVDMAGSVHFLPGPGGFGTIVEISLKYDPPGGQVGAMLARWLGGGLEDQVRDDLRRFKCVMETGEAPATDGQPQGSCAAGYC